MTAYLESSGKEDIEIFKCGVSEIQIAKKHVTVNWKQCNAALSTSVADDGMEL